MIAFIEAALAGPVFLEELQETQLDCHNNWPRLAAEEGGWRCFAFRAGEYWHSKLDPDFQEIERQVPMMGRHDTQDHAITRCDDGTWAHFATWSEEEYNDSAAYYHYDAEFQILHAATLARAESPVMHVDVPAVCSGGVIATAFADFDGGSTMRLVEVDVTGGVVVQTDLAEAPEALGSSLWVMDGTLYAVGFGDKDTDHLMIRTYDEERRPLGGWTVDVSPEGIYPYWAQGMTRVRDTWLVVSLGRDPEAGFRVHYGNVYLSAFDDDWILIDQIQVTDNTPPHGDFQPAVTVDEDRAYVSYAREPKNWVSVIQLDLEAMTRAKTETVGDTGVAPEPSLEAGVEDPPPGCTARGASPGAALLAVPALRRRKRDG